MKLIKFLSVVIVTLVICNVTLTNRTVDEGVVVSSLTREIADLQNQNTILKSQIAISGSIGSLTAKLEESGYVSAAKIVTISEPTSVASR